MKNKFIKNKKGFTLMELLVVIFIIILISSLITVYFFQIRKNARDNKRLANISEIQIALENYKFFEGEYPAELIPGEPLIGSTTEKIFLNKVPKNPNYYNLDCSFDDYKYFYDVDSDFYKLSFCLEGSFENYNEGAKCAFMGEVFEGNCFFCESQVSDIDGNVYQTVAIEDQCWIAENLKVTKYNDGTDIDYPGSDDSAWASTINGAYACWDNNVSNCDIRGAFYNFYTIEDSRGLCPEGWHVPTHNDYTKLERNVCLLGGNSIETCEERFPENDIDTGLFGVDEGKKLKTIAYLGTNDYGFNIIGTNYRHDNGSYYTTGENWGYQWTSTEATSTDTGLTAWRRLFGDTFDTIQRVRNANKNRGCTVRCLKD